MTYFSFSVILMKGNENIMGKEIKVVCGLIYDDEFHTRTGRNQILSPKRRILKQMLMGMQVYVCSKCNESAR